ncbi:TonB-dependent receptor plug domain-containing protein [Candidatus Margulisiibacteriota bacterium]
MFYIKSVFISVIFIFLLSSSVLSIESPVFYGEEVVISASRFPQFLNESPSSVTIISSEEIRALGAKNLSDAIKYTYGVYAKAVGYLGAATTPTIRGARASQTLVYVNGVKIGDPLLGVVDAGDVPAHDIEKIEIIRGPASSLYGADAMGGVINIITKRPTEKMELSIGSKLMERGAGDLTLSNSGKSGALGYRISFSEDRSPGYRENSAYKADSMSTSFNWDIAQGAEAELYTDLYSADKGVPGAKATPTPNKKQVDNNAQHSFIIKNDINDDIKLKTKVFYRGKKQKDSSNPVATPYTHYDSFSRGIEFQTDLKLGDSNYLVTGAEFKGDNCDSDAIGSRSYDNSAVFLLNETRYGDLIFNVGARHDNHSVYGPNTSPRAGLIYNVSGNTALKATYSMGFRAPTLNELYWYSYDSGPGWSFEMLGNPNLKPEKSVDYYLSIAHQFSDRFDAELGYFASKAEDLIGWQTVWMSGWYSTAEAQNIDEADIMGYELNVNYNMTDDLAMFFNYTFQKAIDLSTGNQLAYKPQDQYNLGLRYKDGSGYRASLTGKQIGKRYDSLYMADALPYAVWDARFEKEFDSYSFYAGAENLFNEDYEDSLNYPMPGRIYYIGFELKILN